MTWRGFCWKKPIGVWIPSNVFQEAPNFIVLIAIGLGALAEASSISQTIEKERFTCDWAMAGVELEEAMSKAWSTESHFLVGNRALARGGRGIFLSGHDGPARLGRTPFPTTRGALEMPVSVVLENPKSHVPANVAAKLRPRIAVDWERTALCVAAEALRRAPPMEKNKNINDPVKLVLRI